MTVPLVTGVLVALTSILLARRWLAMKRTHKSSAKLREKIADPARPDEKVERPGYSFSLDGREFSVVSFTPEGDVKAKSSATGEETILQLRRLFLTVVAVRCERLGCRV